MSNDGKIILKEVISILEGQLKNSIACKEFYKGKKFYILYYPETFLSINKDTDTKKYFVNLDAYPYFFTYKEAIKEAKSITNGEKKNPVVISIDEYYEGFIAYLNKQIQSNKERLEKY